MTSAVVVHYEEALYQVYAPLRFTFTSDPFPNLNLRRSCLKT